ncbi:MAG: NAD-binding protein [Sandaracinaceae bacterium]
MLRQQSGWIVRGVVLLGAYALSFAAFRMGVGTDARPGVEDADLLTHLYYSLGVFVLGGLDLGVPTGGPLAGRAMMWVAYFLGPVVTTSALAEGLLRVFRPAWLERRALRGHIVVVGAGRLGIQFLELLRERDPGRRIVLVDRDASHPNVAVAQRRFKARFLQGDVRNAAVLGALAVERAKAVVLLTDDDLANLEAAWDVAARSDARVLAHVTNLGLHRTVASVEAHPTVQLFNSHAIAAERLYREHLKLYFAETGPEDVIVLGGFGRFGQTILEYLQREAADEIQRAVLVDTSAVRQASLFRAQVEGFESCELVTIEGDLEAPRTWAAVDRAVEDADVSPVYVLATDNDQANLRTAVALRARYPESRILVRTVYPSRFSDHIATERDFVVLSVDRLLREAIQAHFPHWIGL